jgi:putative restriction endonuclease
MSFWWVNHKQTANVEIDEGYIWSPQKNKNSSRNETYLNLKKAKPGETIFSYAGGMIGAIGKVITKAEDEKRPKEFGSAGERWSDIGWMVKIKWIRLETPIKPKDYLNRIAPLLPTKNSPLRPDGNGSQNCYLAEISDKLGHQLLQLLDDTGTDARGELDHIDYEIQEDAEAQNIAASHLAKTQREQLILARIGQGVFRSNVEKIEACCRITGVDDKRLLIASHIKSWKDSNNRERLDGNNGFLMSPHVDKLFDRGWISFSNDGKILLRDKKIQAVLAAWAIDPLKDVGKFSERQKIYLEYHRDMTFNESFRKK